MKNKLNLLVIILIFLVFFLLSCSKPLEEAVNSESTTSQTETSKENETESMETTPVFDISVDEFYELVNSGKDIFLLDVRTEGEYAEGHLENSVLIPLQELETRLNEIPEEKTILVYCRSGNRSGQAAGILAANGFKDIYNMMGGIADWQAKGYPVVK